MSGGFGACTPIAPAGLCKFSSDGSGTEPALVKVAIRYRKPDGSLGERSFTTYATHHGPIVRREGGRWVAFAMMDRPVEALQQSYLRTKATDLASFLRVAELKANITAQGSLASQANADRNAALAAVGRANTETLQEQQVIGHALGRIVGEERVANAQLAK